MVEVDGCLCAKLYAVVSEAPKCNTLAFPPLTPKTECEDFMGYQQSLWRIRRQVPSASDTKNCIRKDKWKVFVSDLVYRFVNRAFLKKKEQIVALGLAHVPPCLLPDQVWLCRCSLYTPGLLKSVIVVRISPTIPKELSVWHRFHFYVKSFV